MDTDRKHKLEVAKLKRKLKRAERYIKKLEEIAHIRRLAYTNIRDDVFHFCKQWLNCLSLLDGDWRSRSLAKKLWFEHSLEVFPSSEEDLTDKMNQSRLFENGEIPIIKNPQK